MNIIIVLLVIGIAIADTSDALNDTEVPSNDENNSTVNISSTEKHPRLLFPKSVEKIILTTKSTMETNVTTPVKKPVFKIVQKAVKMKSKSYWRTATRRPSLMIYTKFYNDLFSKNISTTPNKQSDKLAQRKHDIDQFRKTMTSNEDDSSEQDSKTSAAKQMRNDKMKHVKTLIRRFHKLSSKISKEGNIEKVSKFTERIKQNMNPGVTTVKASSDEFSSEENEDRQEFIFVKPNKIQEHIVKVQEDIDESGEATTMMIERELKLRQTRSINVIEEENLGTTVSGFKFTGKVSSLNSNLVFRNINT